MTVAYRVGIRLLQSAQLYAVPETVAGEVPAIKAYKYMVVNDQGALVGPATGEVVAKLADEGDPRRPGISTAWPSRPVCRSIFVCTAFTLPWPCGYSRAGNAGFSAPQGPY